MPRMLPILLFAALPLGACTPATNMPPVAASPSPAAAPPAATPASAPGETATAPQPAPQPAMAGASIRGAIHDGNRPPPALRICAHPADGGVPTCIDSPAGATEYRLGVAPGRYYLMGWVQGGELTLLAHAMQIRCISAPCPPDELLEVEVAAGEEKTGIDLSGGYLGVPVGWPAKP